MSNPNKFVLLFPCITPSGLTIGITNIWYFFFNEFKDKLEDDKRFMTPYTTNELELYDGCCLAVIRIDFLAVEDPALYIWIGFPEKVLDRISKDF